MRRRTILSALVILAACGGSEPAARQTPEPAPVVAVDAAPAQPPAAHARVKAMLEALATDQAPRDAFADQLYLGPTVWGALAVREDLALLGDAVTVRITSDDGRVTTGAGRAFDEAAGPYLDVSTLIEVHGLRSLGQYFSAGTLREPTDRELELVTILLKASVASPTLVVVERDADSLAIVLDAAQRVTWIEIVSAPGYRGLRP